MRWRRPKAGDTRIVKRFLFFPCTLKNETRWLEFANILQIYFIHFKFPDSTNEGWRNLKWAD